MDLIDDCESQHVGETLETFVNLTDKDNAKNADESGYDSSLEVSSQNTSCPSSLESSSSDEVEEEPEVLQSQLYVQHPKHRSSLDREHHLLGLEIGMDEDGQHIIVSIPEDGLIYAWLASGSQALQVGDIVTHFNDLRVKDWHHRAVVDQFTAVEDEWTLTVKRPSIAKGRKKWHFWNVTFKLIVNDDVSLDLDITVERKLYFDKGTYITDIKHYEISCKWVYIHTGYGNHCLKFEGGNLVVDSLNSRDENFRFYMMFFNGTDQDPKDAGETVYLCQIGNLEKNRFVTVLSPTSVGVQATPAYRVKNNCIKKPDPKLFKQHKGPNHSVYLESLIQPDHYVAVTDEGKVFLKEKRRSSEDDPRDFVDDHEVSLQFFFDEPSSVHGST
ncbi:uncharacterized protein LOC106154450 [Lingula anatina]|uniref:Uncharacterized protein LOC106154450 n=1 Tax=Lingula anatina TaxID=7574 RepID=A0A1S3HFK3_LINAN|nr:uncharacterized protein LOC106154450 [Lingula anatina]|eukprot:XP_013384251.1 uncharacterized protein LOC106154450 [Lingula anatina]